MSTKTYDITKASHDSEEAAQITNASINNEESSRVEGFGGGGDDSATSSSSANNKRNGQELNGHLDPRQRRTYLAVFGVSLVSALVGLLLILIWFLQYRSVTGFGFSDAKKLSNLHPLLMYTFMVSLNMYAVLVYRTHYYLPKAQLKWIHATLSGGNIVMSLLGVLAMYKAHLMAGIPNFYSLHSWIGAATNGFYLMQFVFGFAAFLKPGLSADKRAALMPWHRLLGAAVLVLAAFAALTGIVETANWQAKDFGYANFEAFTFIANLAGVCVLLTTGCTIYLLTASQFRRPNQPEELPLKR